MPSDTMSEDELADPRNAGAAPSRSGGGHAPMNAILPALAVGVISGAIVFALSPELARHPISLFVYAAAFASAVLLVFFIAARGWFRLGGAGGLEALRGFPAGIALTDLDGRAVVRRKGAVPASAFAEAPSDLVYRIGRRAIAHGAAFADAPTGAGRSGCLLALRVGDDRLLWATGANLDESLRLSDLRGAPWARFSAEGDLVEASESFASAPPPLRQEIDRIAAAGLAGDCGAQRVAAQGGGRGVQEAVLIPCGDRGAIAIICPGRADEDAGASALFDGMPVPAAELTEDGVVIKANAAAKRLLGPKAAPGSRINDLVEGLSRPINAKLRETAEGLGSARAELARGVERRADPGGALSDMFLQVAMTRTPRDDGASIIAVFNDATELKTLEQQFVQSQKMQAVGQLAGGVAHDFNNLLTAILGHCDLMAMRMDETAADYEDLTQIRQNANRAAALVRQLLAFSRQQKLNPSRCALADVLGELSNLLDRLIGEKVTLDVVTEDGLWDVFLDAQQFEQVILNLVVNARDAMPDGGAVRIACSNVVHEAEYKRDRAVVPPGRYVSVEVSDDGVGMTEEVREKVFEPFFTTKAVGEGTGLGLSTVYGIVKQTGGFIFIDSEPGAGASFRILFPRSEDNAARSKPGGAAAEAIRDLSGRGRILLVEDEAPVRTFARRALTLRGYEVIEAPDAESALEALRDPDLRIDLAISDVVMPGGDGPSWVREARKTRPDVPVIFTSGYSEDILRKGVGDIENCSFLPKPFSLDELALAVKERMAPAPPETGA